MDICCIVKPDGIKHEAEMLRILAARGMRIRERKEILYTDGLIESIYDHMPEDARTAITRELSGMTGIALCVEVESIADLLEVVGHDSDPARCAPDTIRARFGTGLSGRRMGTSPWWDNAFHRPIDEREAIRDMALVFPP